MIPNWDCGIERFGWRIGLQIRVIRTRLKSEFPVFELTCKLWHSFPADLWIVSLGKLTASLTDLTYVTQQSQPIRSMGTL